MGRGLRDQQAKGKGRRTCTGSKEKNWVRQGRASRESQRRRFTDAQQGGLQRIGKRKKVRRGHRTIPKKATYEILIFNTLGPVERRRGDRQSRKKDRDNGEPRQPLTLPAWRGRIKTRKIRRGLPSRPMNQEKKRLRLGLVEIFSDRGGQCGDLMLEGLNLQKLRKKKRRAEARRGGEESRERCGQGERKRPRALGS